jgi:hypothetical protein
MTHLNVSFLILSLTEHAPRATYPANSSAETSFTRSRIFHIRGRNVGSYQRRSHVVGTYSVPPQCWWLTASDGIPSTRINLRNFLMFSEISIGVRDVRCTLGWLRTLLKAMTPAALFALDVDICNHVFIMVRLGNR